MDRYLSPILFEAEPSTGRPETRASYHAVTASEAGFKEDWLQAAVAANPDLLIQVCREAGLTDEAWCFWAREVYVDPAGNIDVLLLSESGRVAVVETKLSFNPEGRRSVVAQILEYAIHLPAVGIESLPSIPELEGRPFAEADAVQAGIQRGDFLLIVAGDRLDSRAVKLGKSLLGRHLTNTWDLALVETSVYRNSVNAEKGSYLLVPHLRGAIVPEQRQVVRVEVSGDRPRIVVEQTSAVATDSPRRRQDEESLFRAIPSELGSFIDGLRALRESHPHFNWSTGSASIVFRNRGFNILELYPAGEVRFRPNFFAKALGSDVGALYRKKLLTLFPEAIKSYAYATLDRQSSAELLNAICEALTKAQPAG